MDGWATPTPLPPPDTSNLPIDPADLDIAPMFREAAETGVQYWNQVDQGSSMLTMVYFALIAVLIFGGLVSIMRHIQEMD
jgi:hypothetical protein